MNIDTFFKHYQIVDNPFAAEEARLDPIFERLKKSNPRHPDFAKILGRIDQPSTSIVFGEKGSGKTAIRLLIADEVRKHNEANPNGRVLLVAYDDLNPVLDRVLRANKQDPKAMLEKFRLEDHQDAILSLAVTRLVSGLLGEGAVNGEPELINDEHRKRVKKLPRQTRIDLALLAALYDQPRSGTVVDRWRRMRTRLRLGWKLPVAMSRLGAMLATIAAAGLGGWYLLTGVDDRPAWLLPALALSGAAAVLLWCWWAWGHARVWWLSRKIARDMPAMERTAAELHATLGTLGASELGRAPIPVHTKAAELERDNRYQLTRRLTDVLAAMGYAGMMVLIDRVDEPTAVAGDPDRMKAIVWPMFDNKFLQQERIGLKMLLPVELRHMIHRESSRFFQEARLDKQNMIDRLTWSGATLYDLCNARLNACRASGAEAMAMTDMFEDGVTQETLIDALDQMHQPRDAFKFVYGTIQEHCKLAPEGDASPKIARLTLETVRRTQSERVQDLYRGLAPA